MKAIAGFLSVLFAIVVGLMTSVTVAAGGNISWTGGVPTIAQNTPLVANLPTDCTGQTQDASIAELKTVNKVCLYGDERLKIGYFSSGGPYQGVVGFPYSSELHLIEGICSGSKCYYSADQDMVVTQQSVSQYGRGVVVYKHVSERIKRVRSSTGVTRYVFDATTPDYAMKNDVGRYLWTPSYGVSGNGKWLVVELRDMGLALVNTDTFESRQISTNGYTYGYGLDPTEQLAVSDDGKSVTLVGMNAGFSVIDVTATCGQKLIGDLGRQPATIECPSRSNLIGTSFPNFRFAEHPRFYGDGQQLGVIIHNWIGDSRRVTYLAYGATPAHKLKFLSLGDSFTSGEGETDAKQYLPGTDDTFDTCHVSRRSYPLLIAAAIGVSSSDAKTIACAGARIGDIIGSTATYWGQGNRLGEARLGMSLLQKTAAQEEALGTFQPGRALQSTFIERYDPEIITIGVGGNDAGLMGKLSVCAMPGTCEWATGAGLRATAQEIKRLFDTLGTVFSYIAERHPSAKVYVVGYPNIIAANGTCDAMTGILLDHTERLFIENSIHYLDQIVHAATQKAGFTYLDIEKSMVGKELCRGAQSLAMNGLRFGGDISIISALPLLKIVSATTFHPTPVGHVLIADTILAGHPGLRQDGSCVTDPMSCSAPISTDPPGYWGMQAAGQDRLSYAAEFASPAAGMHGVNEASRQLAVTVPGGVFEAGSQVTIEIRSEPVSLGTVLVNTDGGLKGSVALPSSVGDGFHTLHLLGMNYEGQPIDMYQVVTVGWKQEVASTGGGGGNNDDTLPPVVSRYIASDPPRFPDVLGVEDTKLNRREEVPPVPAGVQRMVARDAQRSGGLIIGIVGVAVALILLLVGILMSRRWAKPPP